MSELNVIRDYYERLVAEDFPGAGEIAEDEPRVKAVTVRGCHGNTQNLLFYSFDVRDGRLQDLKYECQYCDPKMYVVAELVHGMLDGRDVERIGDIDDADLIEALGGPSRKVLREARTAIGLIAEAIYREFKSAMTE